MKPLTAATFGVTGVALSCVAYGRNSPPQAPARNPIPPILSTRAGAPLLDACKLEQAIARIESGNRNLAPYYDVNGMAWGLYGMHQARWCEIGGTKANWGKASAELQRRLMLAALTRKNFKTLEAVARWHNGGGNAHYGYAVKLEREYKTYPMRVAPATTGTRRGSSQAAPGSVSVNKRRVK